MMKEIKKWLKGAIDLLLPRMCVVCGRKLIVEERKICLDCLSDMPVTMFWKLSHNQMADRFNHLIQEGLEGSVNDIREKYSYAVALFFYSTDSSYSNITKQLKYHGDIEAGRIFGRMLGDRLSSCSWFGDVDLVLPVPLHRRRQQERGYNQAEIIAGEVAACLGASMNHRILKRVKKTKSQAMLSVEEKKTNVSAAFIVPREAYGYLIRDGIPLVRHVMIVDDVFTTGSTMYECFKALRKMLPPTVRISVASLGFVGRA